jgi:monofunctional biosynthetic peptidoglycan transglycosylase
LIACLGLALLAAFQVILLRWVAPPVTVNMLWENALRWMQSKPVAWPRYHWRPMAALSPHLRQAVLAGEDQRFLTHHGFDFIELRDAVDEMIGGGRIRGASTVTMQAARSVFLPHSRTLWRKLAEAGYTVLMEAFWSKARILEVYLNTVDWGNGIVGAEAAARRYFRKEASRLTAREAALMAAVLPNPHLLSPLRPSDFVEQRYRKIRRDMSRMPLVR